MTPFVRPAILRCSVWAAAIALPSQATVAQTYHTSDVVAYIANFAGTVGYFGASGTSYYLLAENSYEATVAGTIVTVKRYGAGSIHEDQTTGARCNGHPVVHDTWKFDARDMSSSANVFPAQGYSTPITYMVTIRTANVNPVIRHYQSWDHASCVPPDPYGPNYVTPTIVFDYTLTIEFTDQAIAQKFKQIVSSAWQ